jgi:hypothetical protein
MPMVDLDRLLRGTEDPDPSTLRLLAAGWVLAGWDERDRCWMFWHVDGARTPVLAESLDEAGRILAAQLDLDPAP